MNRYPFIKVIIINFLLQQDGLTGYDIIKYCRNYGIPASSGTVYPHLKTMEDAGIILCKEEGRRKLYHLTESGRSEMEGTALSRAPEFLKNTYFKSMGLAATIDWTKKEEVKVLLDNVDEIRRYLSEYMDKLL